MKIVTMKTHLKSLCKAFALLCFFAIYFFMAACNKPTPFSSPTITVRDFTNTQLYLQKPAQRIICLIESALSGLYMLGA
ncbi:MAG: hypothetical protein N2316_12800, partial [Spirochaetes bacterium]|nr:hypothetical protein [Spirochaetota bacterium]